MKNQLIILLTFIVTFSGCKKLIEIDAPKNQQVTSTVFSNNETTNSALLTIYAQMYLGTASPWHIPYCTGISGDELTNNSPLVVDMYQNAMNPVSSFFSNNIWNAGYQYVYLANAVYEGCENAKTLDPEVKKQVMAEARFIRAYWFFYLTNLYGEIPLPVSTDYTSNAALSKATIEKVFDQITADLKAAQINLNENYVGVNGLYNPSLPTVERVRPNKYTATALLARVSLYRGNFADAETQATILINSSSLYSLQPLNQVFSKSSKEAIWQIMTPNGISLNTREGNEFIPTLSPQLEGKATISPQLLAAFEKGDLRRDVWIGKFTDVSVTPNKDYYYPYKYKVQSGSTLSEYSIIFRLAEQYLIRAEARNEQNNIAGAIADINTLRTRSRAPISADTPNPLPALENSITKEQVGDAIQRERRVELFTEQGHRWMDLKRTKAIDQVMKEVCPGKGGIWNTYKQLWPIPQSDILNNTKLIQNAGYN